MSKRTKPKELRVAPSNVVAQLDTFSKGLGYAAALPKTQMINLRSRGAAMPLDVIELLAELAEQNDGFVGDTRFDAAAARDALARAKNARAVAKAARRLSRRAVSDAVQSLAMVADRSMMVTQALDRFVRVPEGESFAETNEQVRSLMRAQSRATRKAAAKAEPKVDTTPTTKPVAVVNAPGPTPSTLPS